MAYATGTRLAALACFLIGALTLIGIPILWPIGYYLTKQANKKEEEREQEVEALQNAAGQ